MDIVGVWTSCAVLLLWIYSMWNFVCQSRLPGLCRLFPFDSNFCVIRFKQSIYTISKSISSSTFRRFYSVYSTISVEIYFILKNCIINSKCPVQFGLLWFAMHSACKRSFFDATHCHFHRPFKKSIHLKYGIAICRQIVNIIVYRHCIWMYQINLSMHMSHRIHTMPNLWFRLVDLLIRRNSQFGRAFR